MLMIDHATLSMSCLRCACKFYSGHIESWTIKTFSSQSAHVLVPTGWGCFTPLGFDRILNLGVCVCGEPS